STTINFGTKDIHHPPAPFSLFFCHGVKEHAVMNALDFVFTPHSYLPSNLPFPFTVPATSSSSLFGTVTDVATVTTPAVVIPTEGALATDALSTYNTFTPLGFLLYVVAQSQRVLFSGSVGSIFFG